LQCRRLIEVDPAIAHLYGVATVEPTDEDDVVCITGLVEKPAFGTAPSNLAVIVATCYAEVFDVLENTPPGKGRRDPAHRRVAGAGGAARDGRRVTASSSAVVVTTPATASAYLKAIVQLASDREDLGPEFRPWLRDFAATLSDDRSTDR
jgi:UTP--glucose-1-phosphate uridylyltransferase